MFKEEREKSQITARTDEKVQGFYVILKHLKRKLCFLGMQNHQQIKVALRGKLEAKMSHSAQHIKSHLLHSEMTTFWNTWCDQNSEVKLKGSSQRTQEVRSIWQRKLCRWEEVEEILSSTQNNLIFFSLKGKWKDDMKTHFCFHPPSHPR